MFIIMFILWVYMGPNVAAFLANASCCPEKFISALRWVASWNQSTARNFL